MNEVANVKPKTQIEIMAERLSLDPTEMHNIVINTVMPNRGQGVTNEQFVSFLAIANEYKLNPLAKEIYAFPNKGAVQPIVSIDGWIRIAQSQPNYNGHNFTFSDEKVKSISGKMVPEWCKCEIYRKDMDNPIVFIEYFEECEMNTDPWKKKPRRMLTHKTFIQCSRYAFGLSGIMDEDEKDQLASMNGSGEPAPVATKSDALNKVMNQPKQEQEQGQTFEGEAVTVESVDNFDLVCRAMKDAKTKPELNEAAQPISGWPNKIEQEALKSLWFEMNAQLSQQQEAEPAEV